MHFAGLNGLVDQGNVHSAGLRGLVDEGNVHSAGLDGFVDQGSVHPAGLQGNCSAMESGSWLHGGAMSQCDELYALEESSFWKRRCCLGDGRSKDIAVTAGAEEGGPPVVQWKTCARAAERWRDSTST